MEAIGNEVLHGRMKAHSQSAICDCDLYLLGQKGVGDVVKAAQCKHFYYCCDKKPQSQSENIVV